MKSRSDLTSHIVMVTVFLRTFNPFVFCICAKRVNALMTGKLSSSDSLLRWFGFLKFTFPIKKISYLYQLVITSKLYPIQYLNLQSLLFTFLYLGLVLNALWFLKADLMELINEIRFFKITHMFWFAVKQAIWLPEQVFSKF